MKKTLVSFSAVYLLVAALLLSCSVFEHRKKRKRYDKPKPVVPVVVVKKTVIIAPGATKQITTIQDALQKTEAQVRELESLIEGEKTKRKAESVDRDAETVDRATTIDNAIDKQKSLLKTPAP